MNHGMFECCDAVFMLLYLPHSSLIPPQMGSRCSLSGECCTTRSQEPGAGLTALPSTTLSMLSKWEMISSLRRLRWGRTTAQPRTAEPKQCREWKRLQENSQRRVMWKNGVIDEKIKRTWARIRDVWLLLRSYRLFKESLMFDELQTSC